MLIRTVASLLLLLASCPAMAGDGILEINQACAVQTGCFAGDLPGFPVRITSPGSYALSSDLVVESGVAAILYSASGVWLELNGFTVSGPNTCTGSGETLSCIGPNSSPGIGCFSSLPDCERFTVQGGRVRGFGSQGISASARARIHDVVVENNGLAGVSVGDGSIMTSSTSRRNAEAGVFLDDGYIIDRSSMDGNRLAGLLVFEGGIVLNARADGNGSSGLLIGDGSIIRGSNAHGNRGDGITAEPGCLVRQNVASANGLPASVGFSAQIRLDPGGGTSVDGNTVTADSAVGLSLSADDAYRDNAITIPFPGSSVFFGLNLGGNACGGAPCPP